MTVPDLTPYYLTLLKTNPEQTVKDWAAGLL